MVSDNGNGMLGALQVLETFFQHEDHCQEFLIIDAIALLERGEGL